MNGGDDKTRYSRGNVVSRNTEAEKQRVIEEVMRKAKRQYGNVQYDRLNPASYEASRQKAAVEAAQKKKKAKRTRIGIIVAAVILVVCGVAGVVYYNVTHPKLTFKASVCSEQDVIDRIQNYKDGDVEPITEYINSKINDENYDSDGKCNYISLLEIKLSDQPNAYDWYSQLLQQSEDYDNVITFINANGGPSLDELKGGES